MYVKDPVTSIQYLVHLIPYIGWFTFELYAQLTSPGLRLAT